MVIDKKKSSVFTSNIADQIESCKFWKKYFVNKQTVIFVFDINDNCLNKARLLLHKFVTDLEKYTSFAHLLIIGIKKVNKFFVCFCFYKKYLHFGFCLGSIFVCL